MSVALHAGDIAPGFTIVAYRNGASTEIALHQYRGYYVVLYFYPRDLTPLCTAQACAFRDGRESLTMEPPNRIAVLGISPDSIATHARFARLHRLSHPLLSDSDMSVARQYGVLRENSGAGNGAEQQYSRVTFLIGPTGIILRTYQIQQTEGHLAELASDLKAEVLRTN